MTTGNWIALGLSTHFGITIWLGGLFRVEFKAEVSKAMTGFGQPVNWLDDFFVYHVHCGHMHCASSKQRHAFEFEWWNDNE